MRRLAEVVEDNLIGGSLLCARANLEAARLNLRHTPDGVDMNRQWDRDRLEALGTAPIDGEPYEHARVRQLAPLLLQCDCVLDLHSTSRPSPQCLLFRDDQRHYRIARTMGVQHLVTGLHEKAILDGGMCSNVGLDSGEVSDRLGFTYEAGQHTDPGNVARAWEVTIRLLSRMEIWRENLPTSTVKPRVYEVMERFRQAPAGSVPYRFVGFEGGEVGGGRKASLRKLESFELVEADEIIVKRGRTGVVRASSPFVMIMPAPTADPGTDLYYTTQRRYGGLYDGSFKADADARREARAVERMLDLVADDELVAGATWLCFDRTQVLDVCADFVGYAMRLPEDNPHRCITVVGRGDWGGDEGERRAGARYRQAMRLAMDSSVPITRFQLLRGAALGWLDALVAQTAQQVEELPGRGGLRLFLSARQPHSVSMLVVGNLDLALQTGDLRHIRVALVVEAATVEPDGANVVLRIARTGIFSGRVEVISAANRLLVGLRAEHRALCRTLLGDAVEPLLGADGAIEARPDTPAAMSELRDTLHRHQLAQWCDLLRHEVAVRAEFADENELGRFLARTMAATGILDVDALRTMLVVREGGMYVVDPSWVATLAEDPELFRHAPAPRVGRNPPQPLLASEVDADSLERWVGWKRSLQSLQVLPGFRGKDVDLVVDGSEIRTRVADWIRWARKLAVRNPGDVMVVAAGDGLSPVREHHTTAWDNVLAHQKLLLDPNIEYLRLQHARGTHLAWMKDVASTLERRPLGAPVRIAWEEEHGASVNVIMVLTRDPEHSQRPWSLIGWQVQACSVLLSDLHGQARDYKVALFTDSRAGSANLELFAFGRYHCNGLLSSAERRIEGLTGCPPEGAIDEVMVALVARWVHRVRSWQHRLDGQLDARAVAEEIGLADLTLARGLVASVHSARSPEEEARRLWGSVAAWPGQGLWTQVREID